MVVDANPWVDLTDSPPFVLAEDRRELLLRGVSVDEHLPPVPFSGSRDAKVVILNNNPGTNSGRGEAALGGEQLEAHLRSLREHRWSLTMWEALAKGWRGAEYWTRRVRDVHFELSNAIGHQRAEEVLTNGLLVVEYFPYHTPTFSWKDRFGDLPSMKYSFGLVQSAIEDPECLIVGFRGRRRWERRLPELQGRVLRWVNPQNPTLNRKNLKEDFDLVVRRLAE